MGTNSIWKFWKPEEYTYTLHQNLTLNGSFCELNLNVHFSFISDKVSNILPN